MSKPTRTFNKIHFEDLHDKRFEDLCNAIIYPLHPWEKILHIGRTGNDNGVDILATERLENGDRREWFIQCKRHQRLSKAELIKVIDQALKNKTNPPDVLLVIVACDITDQSIKAYEKYAIEKGIKEPQIWTAARLEVILYTNRKDLLFAYFGISLAKQMQQKEKILAKNIALKKRIQRDFDRHGYINHCTQVTEKPENREQEIIIHSIDDNSYPDADSFKQGVSSWYRAWFFGFYHNGIEVGSHLRGGLIDKHGEWMLFDGIDFDPNKYQKITIFPCLRIPFKNIVTYDMLGDEYYYSPHIYCRYSEGGQPHEKVIYRQYSETQYRRILPEEKQIISCHNSV